MGVMALRPPTSGCPAPTGESGCLTTPPSKVLQWNLTASSAPRVSGFCCAVMDTHRLADTSHLWVFTRDLLDA